MFSRKGDTMDTYYEDILKKIELLLQQGDYTSAYAILEEELSMPYIPQEYEEKLISYYNDCRSEVKQSSMRHYEEEDITTLLKGSLEEQFLAIEQLKKSNIRHHLEEIRDYLEHKPHDLVRAYIIEALMEQNLSDEFTTSMNGMDITFTPCFIEAPMDSDGVLKAVSYLREWFENDNPTFTMMCVETLVKESYLRLPFNIDEDEAFMLAVAVSAYVFEAHEEYEALDAFLDQLGVAQLAGYELLLSKHEM